MRHKLIMLIPRRAQAERENEVLTKPADTRPRANRFGGAEAGFVSFGLGSGVDIRRWKRETDIPTLEHFLVPGSKKSP